MDSKNSKLSKFSYLSSHNLAYVEDMLRRETIDAHEMDESWQRFFEGMEVGSSLSNGVGAQRESKHVEPVGNNNVSHEAKVSALIQGYRELGLLLANINPLKKAAVSHQLLEINHFGLNESDWNQKFTAAKMIGFQEPATLLEIVARLRETYCASVGVEYTHMQDPTARAWLQTRLEATRSKPSFSVEQKKQILLKLTEAECFERFLHTRYVGQKRFSVEGGDSLIPMLDLLITEAAQLGALDLVLGMAHRGRLNVLTNIFRKKYEYVFSEFEGNYKSDTKMGEGDVKYHMGYSADIVVEGRGAKSDGSPKSIHLSLASNPSHLEFINPVIEGVARAKQVKYGLAATEARRRVVPVLIHGDAAFAGQGVCYETIQLSGLDGYATGGTIHIVVNNQVGFTAMPRDSRSTPYATDLAKMLETPIFHVNGDDPEAVCYVVQLATRFRQEFQRDIVIDLICYRKYGHNEGDEPAFTQPLMYKQIKEHPSVRELYAAQLEASGVVASGGGVAIVDQVNQTLVAAHAIAKTSTEPPYVSAFEGAWKGLRRASDHDLWEKSKTAVDRATLLEIGKKLGQWPASFHPHPKLIRLLEARAGQVATGVGIDWGTGEALAFGSLVWEGTPVRLSGQDSERGTFSHRHSVLYDFESNENYTPLNQLKEGQARYEVYNSALSEAAVLGFEYGFAIAEPRALTIWEAQFGDFANGAQVIIDQFISSSESKWQRMCGLVLLLPHGYEGQGPEHSSARLERFLQLCGRSNMQVCNLTTPAQLFHALRRQVRRDFRKPLVVFSPKSLLRHPQAISQLNEFTDGHFHEVLPDARTEKESGSVTRAILCTGKIYYEVLAEREKMDRKEASQTSIIRVEQLYPWPGQQISSILKQYPKLREVVWLQEEPKNMGAWTNIREPLEESMAECGRGLKLFYRGRGVAAAPAVGSAKLHEKEQKNIVLAALESEALK